MKKCIECGHEAESGKFCVECGGKMEDIIITEPMATTTETQPIAESANGAIKESINEIIVNNEEVISEPIQKEPIDNDYNNRPRKKSFGGKPIAYVYTCPHCGRQYIERGRFCPYCGQNSKVKLYSGNGKAVKKTQYGAKKSFKKWQIVVIAVVLAVVLLGTATGILLPMFLNNALVNGNPRTYEIDKFVKYYFANLEEQNFQGVAKTVYDIDTKEYNDFVTLLTAEKLADGVTQNYQYKITNVEKGIYFAQVDVTVTHTINYNGRKEPTTTNRVYYFEKFNNSWYFTSTPDETGTQKPDNYSLGNMYLLKFDTNEGGIIKEQKVSTVSAVPTKPNEAVLSKEGHLFVGWYTDTTYATEFDFTQALTTDTTAYAKWLPTTTTYNISYDTNGGSLIAATNVPINTKLTKPTDPIKEGYIFTGWYTDSNYTTAYDFNQPVFGDITLYANWQIIAFEYKLVGSAYYITGIKAGAPVNLTMPSLYNNKAVKGIDDSAFASMTSLQKVVIPASIEYIGENAFNGCTNLATIEGATDVEYVGTNAFYRTAWLNNKTDTAYIGLVLYKVKTVPTDGAFIVEGGTKYIASSAFEGLTTLKKVTLRNSITGLGERVFAGCSILETVLNPQEIASYGKACFLGCKKLNNFTIGDNVTEIPEMMFYDCSALQAVILPNNLNSIGASAFGDCVKLVVLQGTGTNNLPSSLVSIGSEAFKNCEMLNKVFIPISVTSIGSNAFNGCSGFVAGGLSCQATARPTGWSTTWNGNVATSKIAWNSNKNS